MAIMFLALLSGGMLAALSACRLNEVAWKFVRLVGIVAFVLTGCVVFLALRSKSGLGAGAERWAMGLTVLAAVLAFALMVIAPVMQRRVALARGLCVLGGVAGMAAGCAWSIGPDGVPQGGWTAKGAAILGGQLCGAMLLGTVTVAWMLGHAYLTATRMTIAPLRTMSRLLVAAVALRATFVLASLAILWLGAGWADGLSRMWASSWPALSLRVGAGLVLLALLAYMVLDCVRLRSTQSATGILYFASLLAYVGELSSQHLVGAWGWPM